MDLALTKYNQLKQSNTWKSKTPEEQQLIALTAQLKDAKSKIADLSKSKKSSSTSSGTKKDTATTTTGDDSKKKRKYPEWRYSRKDNQTKLTKDDKTFYWCSHHKMWTEHEEKDCKAKAKAKKETANQTTASSNTSQPSALHIARALVAITESPGEEESGGEDS
jgi:hypothetical protein